MVGFQFRIFMYSDSVQIKHATDHKLLEDVHEESLQIPSQINRFLCNSSDEPLKASESHAVSYR
jgi:hypothetical protein